MASGHIQRFVGIGEGRQFTRLGRLDPPVLAGRLRIQLQVWKAGRWFMCLPMTADALGSPIDLRYDGRIADRLCETARAIHSRSS
jgi:hypothetical protein